MTKHEPQQMDLFELINRMENHTDQNWYDVMGIDIPGLAEAEASGEQDDWKRASEIEADYLKQHEKDVYEIRWPEHVTTPRFNGDATYHRIAQMTTNQNYRIIRLTVTIEPKSPQGGNERCYVARDDQGVWRTYGSVINKPFSMSIGRYLFHAEEIEAEGDGWIDFREYYSA